MSARVWLTLLDGDEPGRRPWPMLLVPPLLPPALAPPPSTRRRPGLPRAADDGPQGGGASWCPRGCGSGGRCTCPARPEGEASPW